MAAQGREETDPLAGDGQKRAMSLCSITSIERLLLIAEPPYLIATKKASIMSNELVAIPIPHFLDYVRTRFSVFLIVVRRFNPWLV